MSNVHKVVVTGASGFVGSHLSSAFEMCGIQVQHLSRTLTDKTTASSWGQFNSSTPRSDAPLLLAGAEVVVHLAGRAHVMREYFADPLAEFIQSNVCETLKLAEMALDVGVRRFVFVSSIGVNGNSTALNKCFTEKSEENPIDLYAISKFKAEQKLRKLLGNSAMELVIVRPPLIYGPGNPGNILKLIRAIHTRTPLPIGQVKNARSFMYVGNLVSALIACTLEPAAAGKTYLVSDGVDLSTPQLVRILARYMGVVPRIWHVPLSLLNMMGKITGRSASVTKLVSSLRIDSSKIQSDLGWRSPFTPLEGLRATADWFQKNEQTK